MKPPTETPGKSPKTPQQNQNCFIKPSLSLTSLPPQGPQESLEMAQHRLKIDRPYNSLKKKRDSERDLWRRSWGSGHSHSSCSLQSSTTTNTGLGKDDFWAALQTNYNYIMDTNLLDSCREARGELEGPVECKTEELGCCRKAMFQPLQTQGFYGDPRRLRQWIKEMENRISKIPSVTETKRLKIDELLKLSAEHSEIYREIVSNSRAVAACIRNFEYEKEKRSEATATQSTEESSSKAESSDKGAISKISSKSKENIPKGLERRYHLLYLKAIEIQCLLEGLLDKTSSSDNASLSDTDEEPVKKLARLSDSNLSPKKEEDESVTQTSPDQSPEGWGKKKNSNTGFDADSEGSDCEIVPNIINYNFKDSSSPLSPPILNTNHMMEPDIKLSATTTTTTSTNCTRSEVPVKNNKKEKSNPVATKRPKNVDSSKFNRSNRKSKNCAIFYFKHADTDSELNKDSSDKITKTDESSSDVDEWIYTNSNENNKDANNLLIEINENSDHVVNVKMKEKQVKKCLDFSNLQAENFKNSIKMKESEIKTSIVTPKQYATKTIKKLVLHAESLVRGDEIFAKSPKTVVKNHHKKSEKAMSNVKINRIEEWLERQPLDVTNAVTTTSVPTTDCEASGEYTDSDSVTRDTDSSEGVANSVATCLQGDQTSQEILSYPSDGMTTSVDEVDCQKTPIENVKRRMTKSNADRPWSVSCISQLNTSNVEIEPYDEQKTPRLSNFSISESALNTMSTVRSIKVVQSVKNSESKSSLKKRKFRLRRKSRISESGSDDAPREVSTITKKLLKSESFSGRMRVSDEMTVSSLSGSSKKSSVRHNKSGKSSNDSEEEPQMAKPNFRIGSITRPRCGSVNLGSLAALATYNVDSVEKSVNESNGTGTGTEELSSFSEQAWDNYQEKYMSEPYSEDRDTDAARRLLDFGDDYRLYIDSQSDCCSSLSAANVDSLSPPRFKKTESLIKSETNSLNRRKKMDEWNETNKHSWPGKSVSNTNSLEKARKHIFDSDHTNVRRRSLRSVDKHNSFLRTLSNGTSSSSNNEFDEDMEAEVKKLLIQNKLRLANTEALKAKYHLLKPEDYAEIISTCRENVRCLESVLRCQPGTVLTAAKCQDIRDTIVSWEKLLSWSERRIITNQFQNEISALKDVLEDLGSKSFSFASEAQIQLAIDQLKNERKVLQSQRSKMLTLNATVHNWISNQEMQRKELLETNVDSKMELLDQQKNFKKCLDNRCGNCYDCLNEIKEDTVINIELKDGIANLYSTWDEREIRIKNRIENLTTSIMTWKQIENGLSDFNDTLDRDRGALLGIEDALENRENRSDEMVNNVKEVVKLLSEKIEPSIQQQHIPINVKLSSSGSLSDSGISDGGGMSDGSLSEREKRLSALKRLVKQLEIALAPGSEAVKTITKRLENAEHELRSLQHTCRKIIMKETAVNSGNKIEGSPNGKKNKKSQTSKRETKNQTSSPKNLDGAPQSTNQNTKEQIDNQDSSKSLTKNSKLTQNRWVWRITKIAVPVQLALVLVMCAACFFEPHCCDALNTYSMSFTPQLRYIKGPPPV